VWQAAAPAPVEAARHAIREALKIHWLSQIECNHHEGNDSSICACGWKSDRGFNVGKAVEFWIDHVFQAATFEPSTSAERAARIAALHMTALGSAGLLVSGRCNDREVAEHDLAEAIREEMEKP